MATQRTTGFRVGSLRTILSDGRPLPLRNGSKKMGALMSQYVALLRAINVGGKNLIRMTELKACLEAQKLEGVATYIQSGNVLFRAREANPDRLTRRLEKALSETFAYESSVVVRTRRELERVIDLAPRGFGKEPKKYRYDVIFLKEPLTAAEAMKSVTARAGVDQAHEGDGVLYFARLISKASQSHLPKLVSKPVYQNMTIRNWNTTTKLLGMMEAMDG
jgi:uncharacterized protein (DUF1697 family)